MALPISRSRLVLIAAISELRELRWDMSERGEDVRGVSTEVSRLISRLNDLDFEEQDDE